MMSTTAASNGQRARQLESFLARRGELHLVAVAGEQRLENLTHDLLVVDDEDRAFSGGRHVSRYWFRPHWRARLRSAGCRQTGSASVKRVPWPTALSQRMVPSCSRTIP